MNATVSTIFLAVLLWASAAVAAPAYPLACAGGLGENCAAGQPAPMEFAAGGCGAAAAAAAASQGGQVIGSPQMIQQGNRTVCVVTVLIKDPTGQRPPTRRQITVPAN
jgi:hypothetical protein